MQSNTAALVRLFSALFGRLALYWRQWLGRRLGDRAAAQINRILSAIALPSAALFLALIILNYGSHPGHSPTANTPSISAPSISVPIVEAPTVAAPTVAAPTVEAPLQKTIQASENATPSHEIHREIRGEIRGVWITNVASHILFAPWGIPRALNQLAELNFNTVYPVVWNRGKTFYRSHVLEEMTGQPIEPLIALTHPKEDPLAEMIRVGHEKDLQVLPWFEYGFMIPLDSPLAQQHPEWLTSRQNGSRRLKDDTFSGDETAAESTTEANTTAENATAENTTEQRKKGLLGRLLKSGAPNQLGWLNPMHPSVQDLLLNLVEEVVSEYDVDGVQLDDHFSLPVEFGYDDYTVALYQAEHQGQGPPSNPADADWIRWRAGKLSKFMNILYARVKASCPSCTVSLSPNPAKFAYRFHLQDWQTWVRRGWVDELVVQVYRDDFEQFAQELDKDALQTAAHQIPVSIGILTGTWRHPITFEQIQQQVERSRDRSFAGVSFFYWDTLWSYFTPETPQRRREKFAQLMATED